MERHFLPCLSLLVADSPYDCALLVFGLNSRIKRLHLVLDVKGLKKNLRPILVRTIEELREIKGELRDELVEQALPRELAGFIPLPRLLPAQRSCCAGRR